MGARRCIGRDRGTRRSRRGSRDRARAYSSTRQEDPRLRERFVSLASERRRFAFAALRAGKQAEEHSFTNSRNRRQTSSAERYHLLRAPALLRVERDLRVAVAADDEAHLHLTATRHSLFETELARRLRVDRLVAFWTEAVARIGGRDDGEA